MKRYINRELSWLAFNERVLLEAGNENRFLKDRFKFLSIFSSNLDEFFMVRVGSLKDQVNADYSKLDLAGWTPREQIDRINESVAPLLRLQESLFSQVLKEAEELGIRLLTVKDLPEEKKENLKKYFLREIYPVLTPMAIDNRRPFPLLASKSIYLAVELEEGDHKRLCLLQVPQNLPRLISVTQSPKEQEYVLLEDAIIAGFDYLFSDLRVRSVSNFRITRNADLTIHEEDAEDLLRVIEASLMQRRWGEVIRVEMQAGYDPDVMHQLLQYFQVDTGSIFVWDVPLDLTLCMQVQAPQKVLGFAPPRHTPRKIPALERRDLFAQVAKKDLFFHVPYDAFDYIEDIIAQASDDPQVLAIKMTLYRVNSNSKILRSLVHAAHKGKHVTVLFELKARFDEEHNIHWAKELEKTGANVLYGVPGLKTHSKIFLIVRKEPSSIQRYTHLGTGNYNSSTAKLYTDMSILTAREDVGADASRFFNFVSGYGSSQGMSRLFSAPEHLREHLERLLENEMAAAKEGKEALVRIKINSLVDQRFIDKLYTASQAGVKIQLIVRGICSLVPGAPGLSENISVHSIIGEFLEHERIYYFHNARPDFLYLSSADLMTRNLDRRIELLFPVIDPALQKRVLAIFDILWNDNVKTWVLGSDGRYVKREQSGRAIHAHEIFKKKFPAEEEKLLQALREAIL